MATYKGVKGFTIQTIAGDPSDPILGQVWYNTTSNVLKGYANVTGAWASGPTMDTATATSGLTGTLTAAINMAGFYDQTTTQYFNGSAWSEENALNQGRNSPGAFGTQTAAICVVGYNTGDNAAYDVSETWNGTSWTEGNNANTARGYVAASNQGTTTAGIIYGGQNEGPSPPHPSYALTESYDGTNWTEVADLNTVRKVPAGGGTSTAAFAAGGEYPTPSQVLTEIWNGTSWTEVAALNSAKFLSGSSGTTTAALVYGGDLGSGTTDTTESWNGTAWTEVADLAASRRQMGKGTGSSTSALCAGGSVPAPPPVGALTEEWSEGDSVVTFTSS